MLLDICDDELEQNQQIRADNAFCLLFCADNTLGQIFTDPHEDDDDMEMAFSPPKPLSMISVFHDIHDDEQQHNQGQGNNSSPLMHAQNIPDQTQPSPTFSQFAPKSGKRRDAESATTPSFRSFKQVDTRRTPFTATPVSAFLL